MNKIQKNKIRQEENPCGYTDPAKTPGYNESRRAKHRKMYRKLQTFRIGCNVLRDIVLTRFA